MKRFILKREMIYTELAEVEADSYDEAKRMMENDEIDFEIQHDDCLYDSSIELIKDE